MATGQLCRLSGLCLRRGVAAQFLSAASSASDLFGSSNHGGGASTSYSWTSLRPWSGHAVPLAAAPSVFPAVSQYDLTASTNGPVPKQQQFERFRVLLRTGNLRGAGTTSPAWVQLVGTHGVSDRFLVGDDVGDCGFTRGTVKTFLALVPHDIGQLRRVHVEQQRGAVPQPGVGWYLESVVVECPDGSSTVFPCNSWLGESDCGGFVGAAERNLFPAPNVDVQYLGQPVSIRAAGVAIPHPEKVAKSQMKGVNRKGFGYGGEDAYFYAEAKNGIFGMGVADGVYAWREKGIDSGRFSQYLMETAMHSVSCGTEDVYAVLQNSARHVQSEGVKGSCTVCMLTVNRASGQLHAANLGDSGFIVYGKGEDDQLRLKYRTNQLEHEFGRPFQIGHHEHANRVDEADLAAFYVMPGDIIIMGSDGLLDNVTEHEICVELQRLSGAPPGPIAQRLTKMAFDASVDPRRVTPYSKGASEFFDMVYTGGKPDDIAVIVAICS